MRQIRLPSSMGMSLCAVVSVAVVDRYLEREDKVDVCVCASMSNAEG